MVTVSPVPGQVWARKPGAVVYSVHVDALYSVNSVAVVALHVMPSAVATITGDPRDYRAMPVTEFQGLYTLPA